VGRSCLHAKIAVLDVTMSSKAFDERCPIDPHRFRAKPKKDADGVNAR
jgi:hypothetical protein